MKLIVIIHEFEHVVFEFQELYVVVNGISRLEGKIGVVKKICGGRKVGNVSPNRLNRTTRNGGELNDAADSWSSGSRASPTRSQSSPPEYERGRGDTAAQEACGVVRQTTFGCSGERGRNGGGRGVAWG